MASKTSETVSRDPPKKKLFCWEDYEDVWREIQIMHHLSELPNVVRIKGTLRPLILAFLFSTNQDALSMQVPRLKNIHKDTQEFFSNTV
nr:Calcium-dependent protein kinase SK5 [Ipomoea batatas]